MHLFLGSFFYIGYLPKAPGTWASMASLIPIYLISWHAELPGMAVLAAVSCGLTFLTTPAFEQAHGKDPSPMVMDEVAGQSLTFLLIPFTGTSTDIILLAAGFLFFRIFDILKPLGIDRIQNLQGARGVLFDDLLAGLYAFICLKILILLIL